MPNLGHYGCTVMNDDRVMLCVVDRVMLWILCVFDPVMLCVVDCVMLYVELF